MTNPITNSEAHIAKLRALSAARQRKRRKQWNDALQASGWTESQFVTAVISGQVTLPVKQ